MATRSPMTADNDGIESNSSRSIEIQPNSFSQEKFYEMMDKYVHEKTTLPFKLNLGQALNFYMWAIIAGFSAGVSMTITLFVLYNQTKSSYVTYDYLNSNGGGYVTMNVLSSQGFAPNAILTSVSLIEENYPEIIEAAGANLGLCSGSEAYQQYCYATQYWVKENYYTASQTDSEIDKEVNSYLDANIKYYQPVLEHALRQLRSAVSFSPHIYPHHFAVIFAPRPSNRISY
jgi:hypothetical protein